MVKKDLDLDELTLLRNKLDIIDKKIISLLEKRFDVVLDVKEFKKKNDLLVLDSNRESAILKRLSSQSKTLDEDFVNNLYSLIFDYSRSLQK